MVLLATDTDAFVTKKKKFKKMAGADLFTKPKVNLVLTVEIKPFP